MSDKSQAVKDSKPLPVFWQYAIIFSMAGLITGIVWGFLKLLLFLVGYEAKP